MPDKWEELLPFYAAGTLEPAQKNALEKHLDGCETCRRSLTEWYVIGEGVRAEAELWARTLPLPRYNGQFGEAPTGRTQIVRQRQRPPRTMALATLVASLIAVLLLGGIVLYMATRIKPNDQTARPNPTGDAVNSSAVSATQTALAGTLSPESTKVNDLGLFTNTAQPPPITPTFTIVFQPTTTPKPPTGNIIQPTTVPSLVPTSLTTPIYGCMAQATSANGATIRRAPDTNSDIVDNLGTSTLWVFTTVNGWYELLAPNINLLGWVWSGDVNLMGADCATLPAPSPTMSATFGACTAVSVTNLLLRPDPFDSSPITARISSGSTVEVLTLSDNYWFMVRAIDSSTGWTRTETLSLSGDCSGLTTTAGYSQAETATAQAPAPTPTP